METVYQRTLWNKYWKDGRKFSMSPCEDFISHLIYSIRLHVMHSQLISISSSLNIHALGLNKLCVTTWCKDVIWNPWASTCSASRYYFYSQIMKRILYLLLPMKGEIQIIWPALQLRSEWNPCAQISGLLSSTTRVLSQGCHEPRDLIPCGFRIKNK